MVRSLGRGGPELWSLAERNFGPLRNALASDNGQQQRKKQAKTANFMCKNELLHNTSGN